MYVLGGYDGTDALSSVLRFDSTQGTWSQIAPMPAARYGFASCAIESDIYVFGGAGNDKESRASVFKFDTKANEWSTLVPLPRASVGHTTSVMDGLVYILGAGANGREALSFDPVSGAYSTLAPTSISKRCCASFVLSGCMYVGLDQSSSAERYDVASNTWAIVANMLEKRGFCSAVTIGSAGPAEDQDLFDSLIAKASRQHA
jgi:hypothetical protein